MENVISLLTGFNDLKTITLSDSIPPINKTLSLVVQEEYQSVSNKLEVNRDESSGLNDIHDKS